MARRARWKGAWIPQPEIATPAGIKQAFSIYTKSAHLKWDREALRGLPYITTDHGPLVDDKCECVIAQNAVHLLVNS